MFWAWHRSTQSDMAKTNTGARINYNPPTNAQTHPAGVATKDAAPLSSNSSEDSSASGSTQDKQQVSVVITTWAQKHGDIAVNGYVDGVVEDGGTCTLTLTKNGVTKTASRPAQPNATNTTCGENDIPVSSLSPGTWQATLSYSSDTANGASTQQPVEVTNE